MKYIDYDGSPIESTTTQDDILEFLYTHAAGRLMLKPLVTPAFSKFMGRILDSAISKPLIKPFIRNAGIDMDEYTQTSYTSFNDFFTRKILSGKRPLSGDNKTLISPCDGNVSVYPINHQMTFSVKHTEYTLRTLLQSKRLADRYRNGYAFVIRLTVADYHRYCYAADAIKSRNYFIPGVLHTVNPIANDYTPIYKENSREYTVLHTREFGDIIQMEVGALMVGKITNHHEEDEVLRGEEKGYFEFGGSTIIVLIKEGRIQVREDLLTNTHNEYETKIHQGDALGTSYSAK